jgi:hypothetical protein
MKTRLIKGEDLEDGMTLVGFMERTATISRVRKGRQYVNFHNDTLGINDRVALDFELFVVAPEEPEEEKRYLVCNGCGEAFDNITAAYEHGVYIPGPDNSWCGEEGFVIAPESEAL